MSVLAEVKQKYFP